jgi:PIN domain nuclease of toxin-antitoxin system
VADLPTHHRDPFDRLLIAQARREGLAVVTADERFAAYDVEFSRREGMTALALVLLSR